MERPDFCLLSVCFWLLRGSLPYLNRKTWNNLYVCIKRYVFHFLRHFKTSACEGKRYLRCWWKCRKAPTSEQKSSNCALLACGWLYRVGAGANAHTEDWTIIFPSVAFTLLCPPCRRWVHSTWAVTNCRQPAVLVFAMFVGVQLPSKYYPPSHGIPD